MIFKSCHFPCSNHSGNIINQKISIFCFEALAPEVGGYIPIQKKIEKILFFSQLPETLYKLLTIYPPYFRYVDNFHKNFQSIWSSEKKNQSVGSLGVWAKKSIVDPQKVQTPLYKAKPSQNQAKISFLTTVELLKLLGWPPNFVCRHRIR